jgi:drug/metabolite transporter (DMT)-like permease
MSSDLLRKLSFQGMNEEFSLQMVYNCLSYTFAAAGEYWIIDWLNYLFNIRLPIFSAMLQNASWPVQLVLYKLQKDKFNAKYKPRTITLAMYQSYFILGLLNTVVSISRTIGLTTLPPTLYVIIANTEIVFEALMSATVLHRKPNFLQVLSIVFVITGVMIALYDPVSHRYGAYQNVSSHNLSLGVCLSLLSRFVSSLNTILADK